MLAVIHNLLTIFAVTLVFAALATLVWFFYSFFLRRIVRARHIANLRLRRMITERSNISEEEKQ